ncbi:MAG: glycoside hydrolase family 38 C-terminal domain-containing protein [Victivallales bacterium]
MNSVSKNIFHIISHTHWDREWYLTFQTFRAALVEMVDYLLEVLENNPEFKFMFDGQTVVLEDYLEIKPENEKLLNHYISTQRLSIGPWYILPDEFLPDGESLIRNLLIGHQIAERLGGVMKVGYIPDTFGHIAALPQIFGGFGIDNAVIWRGVESLNTEFIWRAPDGTEALTVWLPTGYANIYELPENPSEAREKLIRAKEMIIEKAPLVQPPFLMLNGVDHMAPQGNLPELIKGMNALGRDGVKLSSLPEYIQTVKSRKNRLEKQSGEMISPRHYFVHLSGMLASRIYLKQSNAQVEDTLRGYAEPLALLAFFLCGRKYPAELLRKAWKLLIQNHAHDSICGCSTDEVHEDMRSRFKAAGEIAAQVIRQSFRNIAANVNFKVSAEHVPFLVFNPLNFARNKVVTAIIDLPPAPFRRIEVFDGRKNNLPCQARYLGKKKKHYFLPGDVSRKIPTFAYRDFWEVSFMAADLPALGCNGFSAGYTVGRRQLTKAVNIGQGKDCLENEYLKLKVRSNGAFDLLDKRTGAFYEALHYFEDGGDAGDGYNYSPPLNDQIFTSKNVAATVMMHENGPFRAALKIVFYFTLPTKLNKDRQHRSRLRRNCRIETIVSLTKGSGRIEVETRIDNRVEDHRLRVAFGLDCTSGYAEAGAHFNVLRREVPELDYPEFEKEADFGLRHQHYFVDFGANGKKLALCAKGLPQYQLDKSGTLYLTLLRSVGYLVREDLLSMKRSPGSSAIADWPTPDAQCQGKQIFNYALIPHGGSWEEIARKAFGYRLPVLAFQGEEADISGGIPPENIGLVNIEGENVHISAVKKAEKGDFPVVRFYNLSACETNARLRFERSVSKIRIINFNEEFVAELDPNDPVLTLKPYEIKTVGLWF